MLTVVQLPLFEPRGLDVGLERAQSSRLRKPAWADPGHPIKKQNVHGDWVNIRFVRGFGGVVDRKVPGLRGEFAETRDCVVRTGLRVGPVEPFTLPDGTTVDLAVRDQRLFLDGHVVGKLEVELIARDVTDVTPILSEDPVGFARHLLGVPCAIGGRKNPLGLSGDALAEHYRLASTWRPTGLRRFWQWITGRPDAPVKVGPPLLTLLASRRGAIPNLEEHLVAHWRRCRIYAWEQDVRGVRAWVVAIAEDSRRNSDLTDKLRRFLNRMHAELFASDAVITALQHEADAVRSDERAALLRRKLTWFQENRLERLRALVLRIGRQGRALRGDADRDAIEMGEAVLSRVWLGRYDQLERRLDALWSRLDGLRGSVDPGVVASRVRFKLFVSYRRVDTGTHVRQLVARLREAFPKAEIFLDVESIRWGADFRVALSEFLHECDFVVPLVGPQWAGQGEPGHRRIDDPEDYVRLEVAIALGRDVEVLPVLVGSRFPEALPGALASLRSRSALSVDPTDAAPWEQLVERLANRLAGGPGS